MDSPPTSWTPSRLLPDKFIVSPPCSFANHPSRRGIDRPTVSVNRDVVTPHGCRQTTRAAIGRDEHAFGRLERAPLSGHAVGAEVDGPVSNLARYARAFADGVLDLARQSEP